MSGIIHVLPPSVFMACQEPLLFQYYPPLYGIRSGLSLFPGFRVSARLCKATLLTTFRNSLRVTSSRQKLKIWTVSVHVFELESIQICTSLVLPRHVSRSTQLTSLTSSPPYYLTKSTHHEAPFFSILQGFSHQLSLSAKYSPQPLCSSS